MCTAKVVLKLYIIDQLGTERENSTIKEVDSHPNTALFDHAIMSPTYQEHLKHRIETYLESNGREI